VSFNFIAAVTVCSDFGAQEKKICCYLDFSLIVASRGYTLLAVHGLLIVVVSVAEHWAPEHTGFSS